MGPRRNSELAEFLYPYDDSIVVRAGEAEAAVEAERVPVEARIYNFLFLLPSLTPLSLFLFLSLISPSRTSVRRARRETKSLETFPVSRYYIYTYTSSMG